MKKLLFLAMLLVASMVVLAACNRNNDDDNQQGAVDPTAAPTVAPTPTLAPPPPVEPISARDELLARAAAMVATPGSYVVNATTTRPDANILGGWTNIMPNAQTRTMMAGLETVARNHFNEFFPNPIVMVDGAWPEIRDNADGSRTYTFTIYTDNRFSDGTYVNAVHYVGGLALAISPQWRTLVPSVGDVLWLEGRNPFLDGEAPTVTGLRLYNDSQFSITAAADWMPNVWEAALHMSFGPTPLHMYGVEAHDDGNGVYVTNIGGSPLTAEQLNERVMGGEPRLVPFLNADGTEQLDADGNPVGMMVGDGLRYRPTVFAGPWMFESVDVGNGVLTLLANPYFPGTWDGYRPRIERVFWRFSPPATILDNVVAEGHMMIDQGDGTVLENAMNLLADTHYFVEYAQFGQRLIQFQADTGPTQFTPVRQALAFMLDRHRINEEAGRGFSTVAHGPWAPAWWWYQDAVGMGLYDRIHIYDFNMARAIELLVNDGWVLDANGNPYEGNALDDPTNIRHKLVREWHYGLDDEGAVQRMVRDANGVPTGANRVYTGEEVLMPLVINWYAAVNMTPGRQALELQLPENLALAGGQLVQHFGDDWSTVMAAGYRREERVQMFYLGVGMGNPWTPWNLMSLDWIPQSNWGQVDNPVTRELADRFRTFSLPEDHDAFVEAFIDYMEHLTYEVYSLPTRMGRHFDFIPNNVGGWFNTSIWQFPMAITRAYIR
jgi:peptide/nickel transport system substrate-binding protein